MKFLEYEISTGRILSEITCDSEPEPSEGTELLRIGDYEEIDTASYAVRDGALVRTGETNQERLERERIRREHSAQCRMRLKSMCYEGMIAFLANDEDAIKQLRREYRDMKAYL